MSAGSRMMVVLLNTREMEWDRMGGLYISVFTPLHHKWRVGFCLGSLLSTPNYSMEQKINKNKILYVFTFIFPKCINLFSVKYINI